jgi:hypothetical protein
MLVSMLLFACTTPRSPTPRAIETGPDAEITFDGLHRLDGRTRFQRVWIKPGLQLAGYSKLLPIDAGVHYRRPPRSIRGEFPLSETQRERIRQGLRDAAEAELTAGDRWQFVTEAGPDVLVVRAAIIDLVVTAPPQPRAGRDRSFTASLGQATLIVEIFDSESLEILARIADRREIDRDTGTWRNDSINNRAAASRLFRDWARRLRDGLDFASSVEWDGNEAR